MSTDPIIGHKTFYDPETRQYSHVPLHKSEADTHYRLVTEAKKRRLELMPDEQSAIRMLFDAWVRLKELGWSDAIYCPKDGSEFEVIEAGSTGIHRCVYQGEWPNGGWWILEAGDMSPSYPILFRKIKPGEQ